MSENELVGRLVAAGWKGSRDVALGPGDDAAVLRGGLVASTDMTVEGVHFRFDWVSAREAGFRAAAAALSDMAAMGARPVALLVSMALPGDPAVGVELQRGVRQAGDRVGVAVVGGDASRSPGPVVLDVAVLGRAAQVVLRSGAAPGHDLWVSGVLGGAAAAVAAWSAGARPPPAARERFVAPPNRVPLGRALAREGLARSMIDLSDGLLADGHRIAAASGARVVVREQAVPVDPAVFDAGHASDGHLNLALTGGEDYELMFTAATGAADRVRALARELSVPVTRVGTLEPGAGVFLESGGERREVTGKIGHDHFATT